MKRQDIRLKNGIPGRKQGLQSATAMLIGRARKSFYLPGNAWILTSSSAFWSIGGAMASPYQSLFYFSLGASPVLIGYLAAVTSLISALSQLIGGYVGDVWGRKRAIVVFSFVGVANNFIFFIVPGVSWLVLPVVIGSVAGIYGPLFSASLTESMDPHLRPRGIASYSFVNTIPSVFSPYIGGLLISHFGDVSGLRFAFFAAGTTGLAGIIYRSVTLTESYRPRAATGFVEFWRKLVHESSSALVVAGKQVRTLLYFASLAAFGVGLTSSFSVLYFVQSLGFEPYLYGVVVGITALVSMILLFPAARMAEKIGLKRAVLFASLSVPFNQLFFTYAKDISELITWSVVGGTGSALLGPPLTSLQSDLVPRYMRGRIMALFSAIPLLVSIPAQIAGGYLYTLTPIAPFLTSIPVFTASVFMILRIREPATLQD